MGLDVTLTERRAEYAGALERALDKVVAHLASMPGVERVVLFGLKVLYEKRRTARG